MNDSSSPVGSSGLGWARISQQELDRVLRLHERFLSGQTNGQRALLKFHDLSGQRPAPPRWAAMSG